MLISDFVNPSSSLAGGRGVEVEIISICANCIRGSYCGHQCDLKSDVKPYSGRAVLKKEGSHAQVAIDDFL